MTAIFEEMINKVICGNAQEVSKGIPDESIDCIITSPPYYGLRDYQVNGQIGLEKTPEEYVEHLMEVFKECKRVLKKTGTFWLNIGDTYYGGGHGGNTFYKTDDGKLIKSLKYGEGSNYVPIIKWDFSKYQPKCMLMMPERVAFALINDSWILRNKIIWYKRNHMPSSVKDRFSNSWEYIFFFTKSKKYYFDLDAVREAHKYPDDVKKRIKQDAEADVNPFKKGMPESRHDYQGKFNVTGENAEQFGSPRARTQRILVKDKGLTEIENLHGYSPEQGRRVQVGLRKIDETAKFFIEKGSGGNVNLPWRPKTGDEAYKIGMRNAPEPGEPNAFHLLGKNPGDLWDITTKAFKEAHFAVFPEELCEKPIKAGCPENGIVLDPFAGAGTALLVAKKLGRNYIGIDLKPEYCEIAKKRLEKIPERLEVFK